MQSNFISYGKLNKDTGKHPYSIITILYINYFTYWCCLSDYSHTHLMCKIYYISIDKITIDIDDRIVITDKFN